MVLLPAVGRLCSALISITAHPAVGRPSVGRLCSALVSITALPAVGRPRLVIIQDITAVYSPVVDSAFEVSLALHRTTTWRWRLAERHVRLTVRRLKQGDDDNDVAAVHQPLAVVAAVQGS